MTIIHEYHDIAAHIWPIQTPKQDTNTTTQLKPPISKSDLRQIGRLAKLRNKGNKITRLHPDDANNHALNPVHINEKNAKLLNPTTLISASEAHKQCIKAIGTIIRQASNTLNENIWEKENKS
jgi:hypothetical protein